MCYYHPVAGSKASYAHYRTEKLRQSNIGIQGEYVDHHKVTR